MCMNVVTSPRASLPDFPLRSGSTSHWTQFRKEPARAETGPALDPTKGRQKFAGVGAFYPCVHMDAVGAPSVLLASRSQRTALLLPSGRIGSDEHIRGLDCHRDLRWLR
jgi:hypothetical protein